jgi:hypothetical protein
VWLKKKLARWLQKEIYFTIYGTFATPHLFASDAYFLSLLRGLFSPALKIALTPSFLFQRQEGEKKKLELKGTN